VYLIRYYFGNSVEVRSTDHFVNWLQGLRDTRARAVILARIRRLADGNAGDAAPVGGGVSEVRIHSGPGYRVYFTRRGTALVVLLAGGSKHTQHRDIARARALAQSLSGESEHHDPHAPL